MTIPEQLKHDRFIICGDKKQPIEKDWIRTANYSYEEIIEKNPQIYGVITGNNFVVVDCDDVNAQNKLLEYKEFNETFTVKTAGKGLNHFYFKSLLTPHDVKKDGHVKSFYVDDANGKRLIDVKAHGGQVIAPGSKIGNRHYEVVNDAPIQEISYQTLINVLKNVGMVSVNENAQKSEKAISFEYDDTCQLIKDKIPINRLLSKHFNRPVQDFPENKNTMCPLGHSSEGGKCFSFNKDVWHCFHCGEAGNVLQLYQKLYPMSFPAVQRNLLEMIGIEDVVMGNVSKIMKNKDVASEMFANLVMRYMNIRTIRYDKNHEMWCWRDGIWVPEAGTYVEEMCADYLKDQFSKSFMSRIIDKVKLKTYVKPRDFFDAKGNINEIPLKNGVLDMEKMTMRDYDKDDVFFSKIPVIYDHNAPEPIEFISFVNDVLEKKDDVLLLQEVLGYCLIRKCSFEKTFFFNGTGANGKSQLCKIITAFFGEDNVTGINLANLSSGRFDKYGLNGKYVNIVPDMSSSEIKEPGVFNMLTSGERMTADRKFINQIEFTPFAKHIFSCNELPFSETNSVGYYRRFMIIDFPYRFETNPNPTNPMSKQQKTDVSDNVINSKSFSGMLNWMLEGRKRLLNNGKFTINKTPEQIMGEVQKKTNSFFRFCTERIQFTSDGKDFHSYSEIEQAYVTWHRNQKFLRFEGHKATRKKILEMLGAFEKDQGDQPENPLDTRRRGWGGLKILK